jgi:hypothetical protein
VQIKYIIFSADYLNNLKITKTLILFIVFMNVCDKFHNFSITTRLINGCSKTLFNIFVQFPRHQYSCFLNRYHLVFCNVCARLLVHIQCTALSFDLTTAKNVQLRLRGIFSFLFSSLLLFYNFLYDMHQTTVAFKYDYSVCIVSLCLGKCLGE